MRGKKVVDADGWSDEDVVDTDGWSDEDDDNDGGVLVAAFDDEHANNESAQEPDEYHPLVLKPKQSEASRECKGL